MEIKEVKITDVLTEQLEDELEGIKEYDELYKKLKDHGMHKEAKVVEAIANDEYKHACAIYDMLMDHDVDLTHHDKIQHDWECVKKIFSID